MLGTRLGRTGLEASVMGLGCGGHSRLGIAKGIDTAHAVDIVRGALDLGVTYIDTAPAYGTEAVVGEALAGRRDEVVLATKSPHFTRGRVSPHELTQSLEASLRALRTDRIDLYQLHGIMPGDYAHCREALVPVLLRMREAGKIRFLGITERFAKDTGHAMLEAALEDGVWDAVMVGFNLLNPSARARVLARAHEDDVGVLAMFAVRRALSQPEALARVVGELIADGKVPADALDRDDPLGFLTANGEAASLVEAAYRFCRHEPGVHVILSGTSSLDHLRANAASIQGPRLPQAHLDRLERLFGAVDGISGN